MADSTCKFCGYQFLYEVYIISHKSVFGYFCCCCLLYMKELGVSTKGNDLPEVCPE